MAKPKLGWQRVTFYELVRVNKEPCTDPEAAGIERVIRLEHLEPDDLGIRSWAHIDQRSTFTFPKVPQSPHQATS